MNIYPDTRRQQYPRQCAEHGPVVATTEWRCPHCLTPTSPIHPYPWPHQKRRAPNG